MKNVTNRKGEGRKRYKREELSEALPSIPVWPDQLKETGMQLLTQWMDQERREAFAVKIDLPVEKYREFCEKKRDHYKQVRTLEWDQLNEGKILKPTVQALLFRALFEQKITFYEEEIGKKSDRRDRYHEIIRLLVKGSMMDPYANTNLTKKELKNLTLHEATKRISDLQNRFTSEKQVIRIIEEDWSFAYIQ